jgi:biopolymer transport protein TolQ
MDIPVVAMIVRAGWVARVIFIILFIFSIVCWAVVINRFFYLGWAKKMHKSFRARFNDMAKLTDIESFDATVLRSPLGMVGKAGTAEFRRIIADAQAHGGVKDWSFFLQNQFSMAAEKMQTELSAGVTKLDKALFILAIIASSAPFTGLLGTVWGIMDSFFQIGQQGSASLPVVAPGIAEALIATAFALAVAIPAVFFYNIFNHRVERLETEMEDVKDLISLRLRREILNMLYGSKQHATSGGNTAG